MMPSSARVSILESTLNVLLVCSGAVLRSHASHSVWCVDPQPYSESGNELVLYVFPTEAT